MVNVLGMGSVLNDDILGVVSGLESSKVPFGVQYLLVD